MLGEGGRLDYHRSVLGAASGRGPGGARGFGKGLGFTRRAIERVAENRIREAIERGLFDGLPTRGGPIDGIDEPYDPLWWLKRWIRRERLAGALTGEAWRAARPRSTDAPD